MVNFSRFYINFLRDFFSNIGKFFVSIGEALYNFFIVAVGRYFSSLFSSSADFNLLDWIVAFVVIIVDVAFIIFLFLRIYQFIRRYIKFVRKEIEKDDLLEEISLLNQKTIELVEEKNKILALKIAQIGVNPYGDNYNEAGEEKNGQEKLEEGKAVTSRFVKLIAVDDLYKDANTTVTMQESDMVNLPDLVTRFINYAASQLRLFYKPKIIRAFFAGMATAKVLILEGISGTGKTSLPYAMGKFFRHDTYIIAVQPSWRDRAEMVGYLNEFTKRFNETDFLRSIYETTYRQDLNFLVLDEMNLARVEYYFAEFLSIMEMPDVSVWWIDIVPDTVPGDPLHLTTGKMLLPQNVWFIGTANKDDSTFTITDKVYDRATPIVMNEKAEFVDAPFTENITMSFEYIENLFKKAGEENQISPKGLDGLAKLDNFIAKAFKITFGNRIMKQIKFFVPAYIACGGTENEGIDYMLCYKILRKFETLNLPFLQDELQELQLQIERIYGKGTFNESIAFIADLRKRS